MSIKNENEADSSGIKDVALKRMRETYDSLSQALTGIAVSDRKDWALSIGYLLQRARGGQFLRALMREYEKYRDKGKIKDDYAGTEQCQATLQEILDCLDKDSPDEVRFSFLKKLFLSIATEELSNREDVIPQQYMKIARALDSGEVLVLLASYEIAKKGRDVIDFPAWMHNVRDYSGLKHAELIQLFEKTLIEKKLILPSFGSMHTAEHHRLTSLGYEMCRFIEHYDKTQTKQRKEG